MLREGSPISIRLGVSTGFALSRFITPEEGTHLVANTFGAERLESLWT